MKSIFIVNIQILFARSGWTQEELAEKSGVSRQSINNLLDFSTSKDLKYETAIRLARALDYDFPSLFRRNNPENMNENEGLEEKDYLEIFRKNVLAINKGFKQNRMSISPGLSESTISEILNKKNSNPRLSTLEKFADSLNVSLDQLFIEMEE